MNLSRRGAALTSSVLLAAVLTACGGDDTAGMPPEQPPVSEAPANEEAPATDEAPATETSDTASEADAASSNDADVEFAQGMIVHHRGALQMSEMAVERAENPEVRTLAERIQAAQQPEIDTMGSWLEQWGEDVPEGMSMDGMGGMGGMDHGEMDEGMMAEDDMDMTTAMEELTNAEGASFDRMFLEMMIVHHQDAIDTSQAYQGAGQYPEALELAAAIEADQAAEIEEMEQLLESM